MNLLHPILIACTSLLPTALEAPDKDKLIGTWQMTKQDGKDVAEAMATTIEFAKDGKVKEVLRRGDKTFPNEGKYTVEKDTLTLTLLQVATTTGLRDVTRTIKIISLTDKEMVLERETAGKKE